MLQISFIAVMYFMLGCVTALLFSVVKHTTRNWITSCVLFWLCFHLNTTIAVTVSHWLSQTQRLRFQTNLGQTACPT